MNILYLVTGAKEMITLQVKFSIKTFQAQLTQDDHIHVVTDCPEVFADMPDVNIIKVTDEQITEWKGKHNFFWRSKIMAMRMLAKMYPNEHLMYLDGDTFLKGKLENIRSLMDEGTALMHLDEGCPGTKKRYGHYKMWSQIKDNTYGGITITPKYHMWNAGVVAVPKQILTSALDAALNVCDAMLDGEVEQIVIEQYSLSIGLFEHAKQLIAASPFIGHYWHYKYEWCCYIAKFFAFSYVKKRSHEEELEAIRHLSLSFVNKKLVIKRTIKKLLGRKR